MDGLLCDAHPNERWVWPNFSHRWYGTCLRLLHILVLQRFSLCWNDGSAICRDNIHAGWQKLYTVLSLGWEGRIVSGVISYYISDSLFPDSSGCIGALIVASILPCLICQAGMLLFPPFCGRRIVFRLCCDHNAVRDPAVRVQV